MAAEPRYEMSVHPTAGLVRSQSDGARAHQVTLPSCDCADYINRKGRLVTVDGMTAVTLCKHVAEFLRQVGGWNRPEPEVFKGVTRQRASLLLTRRGVSESAARTVLAKIRVHHGTDFLRLPDGGEIQVSYNEDTTDYLVTFTGDQPSA